MYIGCQKKVLLRKYYYYNNAGTLDQTEKKSHVLFKKIHNYYQIINRNV